MTATSQHFLSLAYKAFRPALFALDPERAHELTFTFLRLVERALAQLDLWPDPFRHEALEQQLAGLVFSNPIGLAAGLDKNAEAPHVWPLLGFGFAELGTVTALPQAGNPKPRLWRFPDRRALVNRMGFNNRGAEAVAKDLRSKLAGARRSVPLGINIGKSRVAGVEDAAEDYAKSFALLAPIADYVCVNVSSPNTPGLRDLQGPERLSELLDRLETENRRLVATGQRSAPCPLFVKVSPDLTAAEVAALAEVLQSKRVAALVATNTTTQRSAEEAASLPEGGLSGAPLRARSTAVIRQFFRRLRGKIPIVGVGGVFAAEDACEKIEAGANLVQLYTALIFEGPGVVRAICRGLVQRLERDRLTHLRELVGRKA
ncbi:MAG: dihydroorotate dehydrogenase (quinone) [Candidatus Binatia bacterium]|nr:MAG: dihydroorotate dehydrogenase (quinone) [Candidatus Binatia bacterium]